jgi:hypothetical protein
MDHGARKSSLCSMAVLIDAALGTNDWTGGCPAVQHHGCPSGRAPTRGIYRGFSTLDFRHTSSRALTSSAMAQKALPIAAMAAVASALLNRWLAQKAERRNPPLGRFMTVDGVRFHYVERGREPR